MKKIGKTIIGFILLVVLIFSSYFFGMKAGFFKNEPTINSEIIKNQIIEAKELTTLKYKYTNVGSFENTEEFYGFKLPFTSKKFIVSYDGEVNAGVNLENIDVKVDDVNKIINVTLPNAEILSHQIDEDSLTIFDEKNSIFNQLEIKDFSNFRKNEMKKVEQDLLDKGFLDEANERSKVAVEEILSINPKVKEEYTVKIK